jgi:glycerol kinase
VTPVLLAVDQGSSSSRCLVLSAARGTELTVLGSAACDVATSLPRPGWVEHDPDEITGSVRQAMAGALASAGASWAEVRGIGLAAQTETFIVWERGTGRPVYPAISWRDGRAGDVCARLRAAGHGAGIQQRSGLPLQPAFTAPKLRWLLTQVEDAQRRAEAGELLFGDVNCWLTWTLSGGTVHVTEPSMASRTMLFSLAGQCWDPCLLGLFGIPERMLPEVRPTAGELARTDPASCGGAATISAAIGDQQAALFGQRCWDAGQAKLTLGTGAFLWCQAGPRPPAASPAGVVASCAWRLGGQADYALEGFVPNAGSITPWLRGLGLLASGDWPAIGDGALRAAAAAGTGGLWCVPALYGLGTPAWSAAARADITGLDASSTGADVAEAALLGVAHQITDAVDAVGDGLPQPLTTIRVDGGMSRNESLLQALADLSGVTLERAAVTEATALGAGAMAGLGAGVFDRGELGRLLAAGASPVARTEPRLDPAGRSAVRLAWRSVRDRALTGWAQASRTGESG